MICKEANKTEVSSQTTGFGYHDSKGREMGIRVESWEGDFVPVPESTGRFVFGCQVEPGHYFFTNVQSTRDGKPFNASQPTKWFSTREERDAYVAHRIGQSVKKAAK